MKNIWKVTFDVKYTHCGSCHEETLNVVANGDGMSAVRKAKASLRGMSFEDGPYGRNRDKWVTCKYRWARLTGLELVAKVDV